MRKTIFLFFYLLLSFIEVSAKQIGEWQVFPSYYVATQNVVAGKIIYSLMDGNLMSYNTEDTEVRLYDSMNCLSSVGIQQIVYSNEAKRLLILYKDGNIDLLDSEDNVINLPYMINKTIYDISIEGKMAYLATDYGFTEIDMKEGVFQETYRLGMNVLSVLSANEYIYYSTTDGIYRCSRNDEMHLKENWTKFSNETEIANLMWVNNLIIGKKKSSIIRINPENGDPVFPTYWADHKFVKKVNNNIMWADNNKIYQYSSDGEYTEYTLANEWNDISYVGGIFWVSDGINGLRGYKLKDNTFELATGSIQPNSPKHDLSYRISWVGNRLLVAGGINTKASIYNDPTAMYYEDGKWTIFKEPTNPDPDVYTSLRLANTTNLIQDPKDPNHHFASLHRNGICEYRDGKFVKLWNYTNSPIKPILISKKYNYCSCAGLEYDSHGNMWMLNSETDTIVRVWKADGKWAALYYDEINCASLADDYIFHSSGLIGLNSSYMDNGDSNVGFFFFDTKGTIDNTRDDRHILIKTIVNQDGTYYNPTSFHRMTEDLNGCIWCATSSGLFVIEEPSQIFDKNFRFTQIKINRNDGSGLADYLLNGTFIYTIKVDGANRKWIGTESDGVFLVSYDGQQTIHHFTTDNSPLISNRIYDIAINNNNGEVVFATDKGLCSYMSDATEAADGLDKDMIECFPNPVNSDYRGPIVVRGLTMDAEVKIISTGGQLVWSGRSNGGQFTWYGTNHSGQRVPSGVYFVVANTADGKKAIVSKIAIMN